MFSAIFRDFNTWIDCVLPKRTQYCNSIGPDQFRSVINKVPEAKYQNKVVCEYYTTGKSSRFSLFE